LTMNVTIASQMLVYLPYGNYLAVSKKLSREKGKRLKMELKEVCQDEEGLIIRTQATDYSTDELISQIERSREMWQRIVSIKKQKKARSEERRVGKECRAQNRTTSKDKRMS